MSYESFVAFRYLRSPRKDRSVSAITFISILGIAIGVMALIVVLSVMNGFERDLKNALVGANSHLTLTSYSIGTQGLEDYAKVIEKVKKQIAVTTVTPYTLHQGLIQGPGKTTGALIKGIDPRSELQYSIFPSMLRSKPIQSKEEAEFDKKQNKPAEILNHLPVQYEEIEGKDGVKRKKKIAGIILGVKLARTISAGAGDEVTVISSQERVSPIGPLPRGKKYTVVGFYETGIGAYDETFSFIDLKQAQKLFRMENQVSGLSINIEKAEEAKAAKAKLREVFRFPYGIKTWIDDNKNLFQVIKLEKLGLGIILTLIILVAAFNIISSLVMLVLEKQKDIAILKSLGAKDNSIRQIFVIQGTVIGLFGTIIGEIGGVLLCWLILTFDIIDIPYGVYVGNRIPLYIEIWQLGFIAIVSFIICFLVTIIPSFKASRLNPVDGLKYE